MAVINTNLASLLAQNSLNTAQGALATSVQRLSSGLRINSAKDDASGLAIIQTMAGHIKALDQSTLNASQAINLAQTADTSMSTVQDILLRIQQLGVAGANGSLSNKQRGAIVTELASLNTQINSISTGTTYNGIQLLGSTNTLGAGTLQNGLPLATFGAVSNINVSSAAAGTITFTAASGSLSAFNGTTTQTIALANLANAGDSANYNFNQLGISFSVNASQTFSDADQAAALGGKTAIVIAGTISTLKFQVGGSPTASGDQISVAGFNIGTTASAGSSNMSALGTLITGAGTTTQLTGLSGNNVATDAQWNTAFTSLQTNAAAALADISTQRATLGAAINQLGYISSNLVAQSANEQAARSTVADTNYSAETSMLTKGQILQQAATAMLAQANQMPNVILSLLK
jgi:flagellin